MELIVLSIHLLVCICLIGLVLLQRSEGGALGMGGGGGGGGSLMSGRGAADALARMTSVAGGFFLVTSLGLTMLSGAASSNDGRSVLDLIPSSSAPATTPAPEAPAPPQTETPDPTESSAPQSQGTQLVSIGPREASAATAAPPPSTATTRAGPLNQRQTAATQPRTTAAATPPRTTPAITPQRSGAATTQPAATQPAPARATPPPVTTSNGAVSGIDLTTDATLEPESVEADSGVAAVRRERAGPDQ